jgi:transcriptional regulator with XRE-family HTH domain
MDGFSERLARVFAQRKKEKGLTQKDLSEDSGVSQSTISELMNADAPKIGVTAAVVARLCKSLNVDVNWLLMGSGDEIPTLAKQSAASASPPSVELRAETTPLVPPQNLAPQTIAGRKGSRPPGSKRSSL